MSARRRPVQKQDDALPRDAAGAGPAFVELGRTGLKAWSGYVYEDFLQKLLQTRGAEVYKEMASNDPVIAAMLYAVTELMLQVTWTVEPASDAPEDHERATFVQTCLDDMSSTWPSTLGEILSCVPYGWSYHELVYKRRLGPVAETGARSRYTDGRIGWRKWPIRSQDSLSRWYFDPEGGVQAMEQQAPPTYQTAVIPIERALLFRTTEHKGNPEGRSLLRGAYRPWYFKKRIEETEAIGIERDLAGYPVYKLSDKAPDIFNPTDPTSTAWKATLERQITNIRRDEQEGAILPHWLDLVLLSTGSRRNFDTSAVISRWDQRIAMTMMADFILLGHEKVGSFALSSNKTHLFAIGLGGLLDAITSVVNRHAIPRLLMLNGWPVDAVPTLHHGDVETPDLQELGTYVNQLAGVGALTPDPDLETYLRSAASFPTLPGDTGEVMKQARRLGRVAKRSGRRAPDPPLDELRDAVAELTRVVALAAGPSNGHGRGRAPASR